MSNQIEVAPPAVTAVTEIKTLSTLALTQGDPGELTYEQRVALPAPFHKPLFDGLGKPNSWICAVCWDESLQTSWPCTPAVVGGVELAKAIGAEFMW